MADAFIQKTDFFATHGAKIDRHGPCGCWIWMAAKSGGYGSVGARGKIRKAHRESYECLHGPGSADGMHVRHLCDVPACVNPAHLELGTHADNMRDKVDRGRQSRLPGEQHGRAKLTEGDVRTIRTAFGDGGVTVTALARQFGVGRSAIGRIVRCESWKHI